VRQYFWYFHLAHGWLTVEVTNRFPKQRL